VRKRIAVTGGAGFVGSHLCEYLLARGAEVLCIDSFYTGRKENVLALLDNPFFELVRHDITIPRPMEVDEIYNLACPASPIHYQFDPVHTTRTCVHGAINMLDLARETGARILQASTSEIYGNPSVHPQEESYWGHVNPIGPRACYDEGKRCAESLFFNFRRQYGTSVRVARIFNTYGPRTQPSDGRVMSSFIISALTGRPLMVNGDGGQTRSFCYVDDTVRGLVALMAYDDDEVGPVNLGNPRETTVLELAQMIIATTNSSSVIELRELPEDDPIRRCPDISSARGLLGWEPLISLEEGIARTVTYFRDESGARL
jgi:UDP-glucuronate decarboxylase